MKSAQPASRREPDLQVLLAYVTNLELEVDRLRREGRFMQNQLRETLKWMRTLTAPTATPSDLPLAEINRAAEEFTTVLRDLQELSAYHPARDQVIAIAVRPLIERIFRVQQRLQYAAEVALRLELSIDYVDWFPARLRHILDTFLSNAVKYRDDSKADIWVQVGLRALPDAYELCVSDNGIGLPAHNSAEVLELVYRASPAREADVGVGLAVVKLLVEQSGGKLSVTSGEGQGTTFLAVLPRYDVDDYLT
ncbi:MAG: ATP-binding protein [Gemmataceae bacterium]|nr:ATP-binding protein [Gemmataceae bacterium]